jgi:hypothetical protein
VTTLYNKVRGEGTWEYEDYGRELVWLIKRGVCLDFTYKEAWPHARFYIAAWMDYHPTSLVKKVVDLPEACGHKCVADSCECFSSTSGCHPLCMLCVAAGRERDGVLTVPAVTGWKIVKKDWRRGLSYRIFATLRRKAITMAYIAQSSSSASERPTHAARPERTAASYQASKHAKERGYS